MNTIGDMQNEKYFYDHYKKFEYNHDDTLLNKYIYISMYMCESILTLSIS